MTQLREAVDRVAFRDDFPEGADRPVILRWDPSSRPISIEILAQLRAFDFGGAAALGVVLALLMAIVFVIGGRFVREGVRTPGG